MSTTSPQSLKKKAYRRADPAPLSPAHTGLVPRSDSPTSSVASHRRAKEERSDSSLIRSSIADVDDEKLVPQPVSTATKSDPHLLNNEDPEVEFPLLASIVATTEAPSSASKRRVRSVASRYLSSTPSPQRRRSNQIRDTNPSPRSRTSAGMAQSRDDSSRGRVDRRLSISSVSSEASSHTSANRASNSSNTATLQRRPVSRSNVASTPAAKTSNRSVSSTSSQPSRSDISTPKISRSEYLESHISGLRTPNSMVCSISRDDAMSQSSARKQKDISSRYRQASAPRQRPTSAPKTDASQLRPSSAQRSRTSSAQRSRPTSSNQSRVVSQTPSMRSTTAITSGHARTTSSLSRPSTQVSTRRRVVENAGDDVSLRTNPPESIGHMDVSQVAGPASRTTSSVDGKDRIELLRNRLLHWIFLVAELDNMARSIERSYQLQVAQCSELISSLLVKVQRQEERLSDLHFRAIASRCFSTIHEEKPSDLVSHAVDECFRPLLTSLYKTSHILPTSGIGSESFSVLLQRLESARAEISHLLRSQDTSIPDAVQALSSSMSKISRTYGSEVRGLADSISHIREVDRLVVQEASMKIQLLELQQALESIAF